MLSTPKTQIGTDADCRATDPKLPEDWICPTPNDVCISLQNGESAYCCPQDRDCTYVPPVPTVWLGVKHQHQAIVKPDNTTFFMHNWYDTHVNECGGNGCPSRGYNCQQLPFFNVEIPRCRLIGMYSITPNKASAPDANLTYKATDDKPANADAPNAPLNISTSTDANKTQDQGHGGAQANAAVIAGATIAASIAIVAVVFAVMIYLRYMRKATAAQDSKDKEQEGNSESGRSGETAYWSYDGRRDANGRLSRKWSDSTLQ